MKSLANRACLFEGFAKATEAYKAEVASLTSERELTDELKCNI